MKITIKKELDKTKDVLVYGIFAEEKSTGNKELDAELNLAVKTEGFEKEKFGETYTTAFKGKRVLVVSLGKKEEFTANKLRRSLGKAVNYVKKLGNKVKCRLIVDYWLSVGYSWDLLDVNEYLISVTLVSFSAKQWLQAAGVPPAASLGDTTQNNFTQLL